MKFEYRKWGHGSSAYSVSLAVNYDELTKRFSFTYIGEVTKVDNIWVGTCGSRKVEAKTRKEASEMLAELELNSIYVQEQEEEQVEEEVVEEEMTEEEAYIANFDAYYTTSDIASFAGKPQLDFFQWFKAKYGMTEFEASAKFGGDLNAFYANRYDVDADEAQGYEENDCDEWNDYIKNWESVNQETEEEVVAEEQTSSVEADLVEYNLTYRVRSFDGSDVHDYMEHSYQAKNDVQAIKRGKRIFKVLYNRGEAVSTEMLIHSEGFHIFHDVEYEVCNSCKGEQDCIHCNSSGMIEKTANLQLKGGE
jgi:hypothetical protein